MITEEKNTQEEVVDSQEQLQENQKSLTDTVEVPDPQKVRSALADGGGFDLEGFDGDLEGVGMDESSTSTEPELEQKEVEVEETPKEKETEDEYSHNPIWDKIKEEYESQLGEGTFKMPENLSKENEYEELLNFLERSLEPNYQDIPDEIREQIELHKEGKYDPTTYFSQRAPSSNDILSLPDKDFMFNVYKSKNGKSENNPEGWDDADIDEFLSKKSKIELHEMAQSTRQKIVENRTIQQAKQAEKLAKAQEEELTKIIQEKENRAKETVNRNLKTNDFFGIVLNDSDKRQFDRDFLEMTKIDKKTGTNKLGEILSDDDMLYKVAMFVWKSEGLKGYITELKENIKEETAKKLDPVLEQRKGSVKMANPVDRSKLV